MQILQCHEKTDEHIATRPIPTEVPTKNCIIINKYIETNKKISRQMKYLLDAFEDDTIEHITRIYNQAGDEKGDGE
jgi:hypothetical protein